MAVRLEDLSELDETGDHRLVATVIEVPTQADSGRCMLCLMPLLELANFSGKHLSKVLQLYRTTAEAMQLNRL